MLQTLVPLLVIVAAFPLFARERESGTLRQLLSVGVPPARLAAGKVAGTLAALGLVILPALAIGVPALALAGELPFARVALLAAAYGAYFEVGELEACVPPVGGRQHASFDDSPDHHHRRGDRRRCTGTGARSAGRDGNRGLAFSQSIQD